MSSKRLSRRDTCLQIAECSGLSPVVGRPLAHPSSESHRCVWVIARRVRGWSLVSVLGWPFVAVGPCDLAIGPVPADLAVELHRFVLHVDDLLEASPGTDRSSASLSAWPRFAHLVHEIGSNSNHLAGCKAVARGILCLKGHFRSYEPLKRLSRE
jgi:hypothetical protein